MKAFKLFRVRKDGTIGSLFCDCRARHPVGRWMQAEPHPTKGLAYRPGWHCCLQPYAPHLSERDRRWYEVEIGDYTRMQRPVSQGGLWWLAQRMRIVRAV